MAEDDPLPVEIAICNMKKREVTLDDGTVVPIVSLLDDEGDETDDEDMAVVVVAGTDWLGYWTIELEPEDYEQDYRSKYH